MTKHLVSTISEIQAEVDFSGSILVENNDKVLLNKNFGYANRSDKIEVNSSTRFGIASGCKLFTAIAISQLVENEKLSFGSKLSECVDLEFKHIDKNVTVHQLLTHTSGIPDYFDEDTMDDFEEVWMTHPMYHVRRLKDFLPLFQDEPMKGNAGDEFQYNNAGYILLGLIVEHVSGLEFTDYIQLNIFNKADMSDSGYFAFDSLPERTALGYIDNSDGTWKSNIYSMPVKGGSDGGAYITTGDMAKLWTSLMNFSLLSKSYTNKLLYPHVQDPEDDDSFYGYGTWIKKTSGDRILRYHVMGYDPGVSFHSAYYPDLSVTSVVCSNKSDGAADIMIGIEEELLGLNN